jgi:hypothetical protein
MTEPSVRELFTRIASEHAPSRVDTRLAHRRGRRRLRWRRAATAGTPVLAVASIVAVTLAAGALPFRPSSTAASGTAAPQRFDPLIPYASFGWLPPGDHLVSGGTRRTVMYLTAGHSQQALPKWDLAVYAAGQCHLTASAKRLVCSTLAEEGLRVTITGPAPDVRGRRAFWAGNGSYLVWQYARGGWASLLLPYPNYIPQLRKPAAYRAARRDAITIAGHVRYGAATAPLLFPVQLTHLPGQWRVSSTYYLVAAGTQRVRSYALGAGQPSLGADGGLDFQKNMPFLTIDLAPAPSPCPRTARPGTAGQPVIKTINGSRVVVLNTIAGSLPKQVLCVANARGLALVITILGGHPVISGLSLFQHHMRVLGADPGDWTSKPIG